MLIFSLYGYGLVLLCLYCAIPEAKSCFWGNLNSRYVLQLGSEIMLYSLKVLDTCVPASQHRFEVQNSFQSPLHRMTWVGRDLKAHLIPTPLPRTVTPPAMPGCPKPHPTLWLDFFCLVCIFEGGDGGQNGAHGRETADFCPGSHISSLLVGEVRAVPCIKDCYAIHADRH